MEPKKEIEKEKEKEIISEENKKINDTDNVIDIYEKITGTKLDLTIEPEGEEEKK